MSSSVGFRVLLQDSELMVILQGLDALHNVGMGSGFDGSGASSDRLTESFACYQRLSGILARIAWLVTTLQG